MKEIQEKSNKYKDQKDSTENTYKYIALLEKPVEERLEKIIGYRKVIKMLDDEKNQLIE